MAGVNKAVLVGNVGQDPEVRMNEAGNKMARFSMATSESWKDKNTGERKERTEWHRVVVFNQGLAGVVEQYVKKGSKVYVEGQIRTRKWQDQQGEDRWSTEIHLAAFGGQLVLLDSKGSGRPDLPQDDGYEGRFEGPSASDAQPAGGGNDFDDEIPF